MEIFYSFKKTDKLKTLSLKFSKILAINDFRYKVKVNFSFKKNIKCYTKKMSKNVLLSNYLNSK